MQLATAKRIVIKIGSSLIADAGTGCVREPWLRALAEDIHAMRQRGQEVILVSSGSVALGRAALGTGLRILQLEEKQAAAACGQIALAGAYRTAFAHHGINTAQILLTPEDTEHRRRYLNARNTLLTLLQAGVVAVINENDTVATEELRFGDNDRLSARVAHMASADLLIILSDIDGLYTANPATHPDATLITDVTAITPEIEAMAGGAGSAISTGGMVSKLMAAKIATQAGCGMIIARGNIQHPLQTIVNSAPHTRFHPSTTPLSARKQWIAASLRPVGSITIDAGAQAALHSGRSLLPAGVTAIEGRFERGDAVTIHAATGERLGVGLTGYGAEEAAKILGKRSSEIEAILGYVRGDALIHRDDMALELG